MARRRSSRRKYSPLPNDADRSVSVKKRTSGNGRLRGRWCVAARLYANEVPKSAVKGVKMAAVQQHGCYVSKRDADKVASRLEGKRRGAL